MKDEEIKEMLFKMTRTTDGRVLHGYQDLDEAVRRYKYFKEWLKIEIPDFTEEEIVKYWRKHSQIKKVFDWSGADEFLRILEKELNGN
jgi:ADP-dependent phosphofructokinase/glucokinase